MFFADRSWLVKGLSVNEKLQKPVSAHTLMPSIQQSLKFHQSLLSFHPHRHHPSYPWVLNHQQPHHTTTVPLKRISQRGSSKNMLQLMSYRNFGICHRKTLRGVTQFIGGMGGMLNFPNFIVLPVIFSPYQVCFQTSWFQLLINFLSIFRISHCHGAHLFWRAGYNFTSSCKP